MTVQIPILLVLVGVWSAIVLLCLVVLVSQWPYIKAELSLWFEPAPNKTRPHAAEFEEGLRRAALYAAEFREEQRKRAAFNAIVGGRR